LYILGFGIPNLYQEVFFFPLLGDVLLGSEIHIPGPPINFPFGFDVVPD